MAFSTYAAFPVALMDMNVTGINKVYDEPPTTMYVLPAMFPRLPTGESGLADFGGGRSLKTARCEIVIVLESVNQNTQAVNFAKALTMMDALDSALASNVNSIGLDSWTMRVEQDAIGQTAYWMLICEVEASG